MFLCLLNAASHLCPLLLWSSLDCSGTLGRCYYLCSKSVNKMERSTVTNHASIGFPTDTMFVLINFLLIQICPVKFRTHICLFQFCLYSADLEVWSKLVKCACIKRSGSKFVRDFDCDLEHANAFPIALLWHVLYFRKISLTRIQKCWFLLLWNISMQVWLCIRVDIFTPYFRVTRVYGWSISSFLCTQFCKLVCSS